MRSSLLRSSRSLWRTTVAPKPPSMAGAGTYWPQYWQRLRHQRDVELKWKTMAIRFIVESMEWSAGCWPHGFQRRRLLQRLLRLYPDDSTVVWHLDPDLLGVD